MKISIDTDYPIKAEIYVKASYRPALGPCDQKDPSVYVRTPINTIFNIKEPISEMMVVYMAGLVTPLFGWRVVIVREEFPDALFEDMSTGEQIRVEFESSSSHFLEHNHSPSGCDFIICWRDTISRADKARYLFSINPDLRIIELKKLFHHYDFVVESDTTT
jgi:hypothetical protein